MRYHPKAMERKYDYSLNKLVAQTSGYMTQHKTLKTVTFLFDSTRRYICYILLLRGYGWTPTYAFPNGIYLKD